MVHTNHIRASRHMTFKYAKYANYYQLNACVRKEFRVRGEPWTWNRLLTVATARLGYAELKDKQKEAIKAFASGKDVFVSLPTGYGNI